ncbi:MULTISPECIES: hypothetical protein [Streptomycetaceae]|uniref:Uncharacterized protein n=1 Tax=Streptantibioticus cattleyicolor (strain ATCC 35852 / DSM 46488 / JCM 4925 / NBRC 14057 / NRRL 8057) TaxID=1003195 RepID=F8JYQ3_STREN|nr:MULTISPECIES: hypothetical protein [Streptomycetaceae]AEW93809.1 hypothetical protein SCATT_14380 [Streptantibioticus cattleyicolor NRRL 8057 = DSM 46488]MYS58494.1 hypothetical protein [Streptomyces sp. SID5468]CCB74156.1 protein of unknown function [Streptantibioticus cattleyicolor NRRL 8057 = DSM 46488]
MTKLIALTNDETPNDFDWFATRGLFEPIAESILQRIEDGALREKMRAQKVSGYIFVEHLPPEVRHKILVALRDELPEFVDTVLYPPPLDEKNLDPIFVERAKSLARMAAKRLERDASD